MKHILSASGLRSEPSAYTFNIWLIHVNYRLVIFLEDLLATLQIFGLETSRRKVDEMLSQAKGAMDCTSFACMLTSQLSDLDESDVSYT